MSYNQYDREVPYTGAYGPVSTPVSPASTTATYSYLPPDTPRLPRQPTEENFQIEARAVANVGFADALEQTKPSPWTKRMWKLYFFLFVAFLNSCINGYDGTLMAGINVMKSYQGY
jgi:hypothetical protein